MVDPGGDMQHPYINFGPVHQHQQDEGTVPPALPPKRSSRSHPGSFRSDGINNIIKICTDALKMGKFWIRLN